MESRAKRVLRGEKTYDRFLLSLGVVLRFGSCLTVLMTRCVLFFFSHHSWVLQVLTDRGWATKKLFLPFSFLRTEFFLQCYSLFSVITSPPTEILLKLSCNTFLQKGQQDHHAIEFGRKRVYKGQISTVKRWRTDSLLPSMNPSSESFLGFNFADTTVWLL